MIENKFFAGGGLNRDVDENFLKPNEYQDAVNIRITDRLNSEDGVVSNVKGNSIVLFDGLITATVIIDPFGQPVLIPCDNKCIGNYANEQNGKYYSFIWNSCGFHTITEYDPFASTITKVLQSRTDTGDVDILNFQQTGLINGVSIVENDLLYWTDGFNPPRGIQISKAKTGTYYTTAASISLIKRPPQKLIVPTYGDDPASPPGASNRLKNQLFQFRYLYVYEDGTRSAWSSASAMPLPNLEISSSVDTAPYKNNHIILQFDVGDKFVKSIEIAAIARGEAASGVSSDWFSILSIDRSYLINYPGVAEFLYNSTTNTCQYKFYNDGLYQTVDIREIDLQYDFVPLKSKTLEVVNGNVLVLGNNTEGYDNLSEAVFDVSLSASYVSPNVQRLSFQGSDGIAMFFNGIPAGDGTPSNSDLITATWTAGTLKTYNYYVKPQFSGDLYETIVDFGMSLALDSQSQNPGNYYIFNSVQVLTPTSVRLSMNRQGNPTGLTASVTPDPDINFSSQTYKENSKYQFGLVYYDEFNRSTYVQTNERDSVASSGGCIVSTKSWGAATGNTPVINWQIKHQAPTWAKQYQWVRTDQLTHKEFLFWAASSVNVNPTNSNLYDLNINSLNTYNTANPNSILNYDFSDGDRCTIHRDGTGWISGYDVEVVRYNTNTGVLTIQKGANLTVTGGNILLEVYTPKNRINSSTEQFFYEFGEVYSCNNGVHSVSAGTFINGDVYIKGRTISGTLWALQDPNFSDFYVSNFSSNGRTNIYAPQAKQLNLPTDIRFSEQYVPNTNINGLSRFYGDSYETYDRVNGPIQKLAVRDNYLMTFQELKTGYIPVLQSIIEDQGVGNAANVAISSKLLNKIRYFGGDFGIGNKPESFARFAGTMYFADPNRCVVLKLTDSLQPISYKGMDSYFTERLAFARANNQPVIGSYDPYNDEYVVSINNTSVAFSESINRWTSFYSFFPDAGGYIFNQYITHKNGNLYVHNTNNTYGRFYNGNNSASITIVYNQSPLLVKSFIALIEQANAGWVPTEISTSLGQVSSLNSTDVTLKEGVYFMNFLRDSNSPGGLVNGDDLKGNWIKMKLTQTNTTKSILLSADVRHIPSYQGVK